jgi:uncharacterized protein (TIGR02118 family)
MGEADLIKMVAIVWRKPGLSIDEFTARWRDGHAPLVNKHKAAMGFIKYVQSHTLASPEIDAFRTLRGWGPPPDGIAELWWESEEALRLSFASQEAAEASAILEEDERHFVDMARTAAFLSSEFEVFNDA